MAPTQNRLDAALARKHQHGIAGAAERTPLLAKRGLQVADILCTSGPRDTPFEEAHSVMSIAVVVSGTFTYQSDQGRTLMTPGSLLIGHSGSCFTCGHEHAEGDRCLAFMFDNNLFERISADAGARPTRQRGQRVPFLRTTAPLIARAIASMREPAVLEEVAMDLARTVLATQHDARAPRFVARDESRVAEVVRYLEQTFDRPHSLLDLAQRADVSPFHFLRVFRKVTGVSPHQMVLRLRLSAAAQKLLTTDEPVTEIAYGVGFEDLSNFIRTFRAEFGASPSRYRGR